MSLIFYWLIMPPHFVNCYIIFINQYTQVYQILKLCSCTGKYIKKLHIETTFIVRESFENLLAFFKPKFSNFQSKL